MDCSYFTCKYGVKIKIVIEDFPLKVISYDNDKQIGVFEFKTIEDDFTPDLVSVLEHMNIDKDYQKRGIGSAMVKFLLSLSYDGIAFPDPRWENGNCPQWLGIYLSREGKSFIESCRKNNIIPDNMIYSYSGNEMGCGND